MVERLDVLARQRFQRASFAQPSAGCSIAWDGGLCCGERVGRSSWSPSLIFWVGVSMRPAWMKVAAVVAQLKRVSEA